MPWLFADQYLILGINQLQLLHETWSMSIYQWRNGLLLISSSSWPRLVMTAYLWSDIFRRKACTSTSNYQIDRLWAIGPVPDRLLDRENVVGHDLGLASIPLVVPEIPEDIL